MRDFRRRLRPLLLLLAAAPLSAPPRAAEFWPDLSRPAKARGGGEKDAAVIVGVEDYAFIPKVSGARANADAWQAYFTGSLDVPTERVALLRDKDATLEKIRKYVLKEAALVEKGGTLWFIFIGHGAPSKDGKDGLLVGSDAQRDLDGLTARSLARRELLDSLAKGRQAKTVVIIDACFSGQFPSGEMLIAGLQPLVLTRDLGAKIDARTILLTAAKSDEFAGPLPKSEETRPAFSYLALGALRGWAADASGRVTAKGLIEFVRRALTLDKGRTQTPELSAGAPGTVLAAGREPAPDLAKIDREGGEPIPDSRSPEVRPSPGRSKRPPEKKAGPSPAAPPIDWVAIPGGSFMMGSQAGDESPIHRVNVDSFELAKTAVTHAQYEKCVDAGACMPRAESCLAPNLKGEEGQPAVCVTWYQAKAFSEWIGGRLPSEAEWEYAARSGGLDQEYPWGNEEPTCERAVMNDGGLGCRRNAPWPVCSKPLGNTKQGLCDMAGNVWEWVQDWYHGSYDGAPDDGSAWERPEGTLRVTRGGSWDYLGSRLRAASRDKGPGDLRVAGFRPAR